MIKKLALLMSVFFIFDRVMHYKIKEGYTQKKFVSVKSKQVPLVIKKRKSNKGLTAQVRKRRATTGRKISNVVKS